VQQSLEIANSFPFAVFCLFTAWRHYELSTYVPFEFHLAIPHNKRIKCPDYPPVRVYYLRKRIYQLGIIDVDMDGAKVKMYDLEKSVCDAVRFRNKVGMDTMIEVLQNYVKRQDKNLNLLSRYAEQLGIEKIVNNMIMMLL
jgi:predicted transcriptional regulator of viral defense system